MKRLPTFSGSKRILPGLVKSTSITSIVSLSKATPSLSQVRPFSYVVEDIAESSLSYSPEFSCAEIGSGRFGTCVCMIYNDMFHVCVKQLSSETSIPLLKAEAGIMRLVSCEYVPYCFGICTATKALIMSLVTISGRATTFAFKSS